MTVASESHTGSAGILYIVIGMTALSLQDTMIKFLSTGFALHQIIFARSLIAIAISFVLIGYEGGYHQLRTSRPGLHFLRAALLVFANMAYFLALAAMPLAEAVALIFVAPLLITAMSGPMLGEHVGPRRWAAIGFAMIGVLIMVRPGAEVFNPISLLPLFSAFAYALVQVLTRRLGTSDKASVMAFYSQLGFIVFSGLLGIFIADGRFSGTGNASLEFLFRAWVWPDARDAALIASCGLLVGIAANCNSHAYRISPAAVVAPFEYVELPLAVLWGYLVWQHLPGPSTWIGILFIVGAGLFVLYREVQQGKDLRRLNRIPKRSR